MHELFNVISFCIAFVDFMISVLIQVEKKIKGNIIYSSGETSKESTAESVATLPLLGPIEGQKWFDQISSQWESQKNRFALIYFGKILFFLSPEAVDMNGRIQMQEGKNWILPK